MKGPPRQPPRPGRWLLQLARLGARRDEVEADLLELFTLRASQRGHHYASRRYMADVLSLCRHSLLPTRPRAGLGAMKQDVVFAARLFRRHPGLFGVTVAGLAVAIAISTAVFSIVNGVAFADYGIHEPRSVFRVALTSGVFTRVTGDSPHSGNWAFSDYSKLRDATSTLDLVASVMTQSEYRRMPDSAAERVTIMAVSDNYFSVLGFRATAGRTLARADAVPGVSTVVVSEGFWKNRLGADPAVLGQSVWLGDVAFSIVGVAARTHAVREGGMPPAFWMTLAAYEQAWMTAFNASREETRSRLEVWKRHNMLNGPSRESLKELEAALTSAPPRWNPAVDVFGRLKPGGSRAQADTEVKATAIALANEARRPTGAQPPRVQLTPVDEPNPDSIVVAAILLTTVGFVVFLACANVTNVLLANAATRRREMGTRLAIGASHARIVRQLLTESLLLGLLGGALGLGIAWLLMPSFAAVVRVPAAFDVSLDMSVYVFVGILAVAVGMIAGLAPARYGGRRDLLSALKTDQMSAARPMGRGPLRSALIGAQAAVSVVLLVLAALLTRALVKSAELDPGYDVARVVHVSLRHIAGGGNWTPARNDVYWTAALQRARALPGVAGASLASVAPFGDTFAPQVLNGQRIYRNETSPDFFATLGVRLLRGRIYTADEVRTQAAVAVISASLASTFWGAEDPLGATLDRVWGPDDASTARLAGLLRKPAGTRVIGVVADTTTRLAQQSAPTIYLPLAPTAVPRLIVRAHDDAGGLARPLREALEALDPGVRVSTTLAMDGLQRQLETPRILASLAAGVGGIALGLAIIGLFGVTAFVVGQRVHEIGVRRALGASEGELLAMLLRENLTPVLIGLGFGLFVSLLGGTVVEGVLYGVSSRDPMAILSAAAVLLGAATVAVLIPARRAAGVDPAQLLKLG